MINLKQMSISERMYTDDLVTLKRSEKHLQNDINLWNNEITNYGMNINVAKTKVMVISRNPERINLI